MKKREIYEFEIPAFLHIASGILLEPVGGELAGQNHDLQLRLLDIMQRRVCQAHPDRRHRRAGDSWELLDDEVQSFAEELPAEIYKRIKQVLRKRRQRYAASAVPAKHHLGGEK